MRAKSRYAPIPLESILKASDLEVVPLLECSANGSIRILVMLSDEEMELLLSLPDESSHTELDPWIKDIWALQVRPEGRDSDTDPHETWFADIQPIAWRLRENYLSQGGEVRHTAVAEGVRLRLTGAPNKTQARMVRLDEVVMLREDFIKAGFKTSRLAGLRATPRQTDAAHQELTGAGRDTLNKMLGLLARLLALHTAEEEGDSRFGTDEDPNVAAIVDEARGLLDDADQRGLSEDNFANQINRGLQLISGKKRKRGRKPNSG